MTFEEMLIKRYGTMIEDPVVMEEVKKRFSASIAALKFAGNIGDNPLCKLNRAFENRD